MRTEVKDRDLEQLALQIALIASATSDPVAGQLLAELAGRLLTLVGLPRLGEEDQD